MYYITHIRSVLLPGITHIRSVLLPGTFTACICATPLSTHVNPIPPLPPLTHVRFTFYFSCVKHRFEHLIRDWRDNQSNILLCKLLSLRINMRAASTNFWLHEWRDLSFYRLPWKFENLFTALLALWSYCINRFTQSQQTLSIQHGCLEWAPAAVGWVCMFEIKQHTIEWMRNRHQMLRMWVWTNALYFHTINYHLRPIGTLKYAEWVSFRIF